MRSTSLYSHDLALWANFPSVGELIDLLVQQKVLLESPLQSLLLLFNHVVKCFHADVKVIPALPSKFTIRCVTSLTSTAVPGACWSKSFFFSIHALLAAFMSSFFTSISFHPFLALPISSTV